MKTIYRSSRPDSEFSIVKVAGEIYAIDQDTLVGGWGKYHVDRTSIFQAGSDEFISVTEDGNVTPIEAPVVGVVFFGDFDFVDDFDDLF